MSSLESLARAVTFRVGSELYAVDVQGVERVARYIAPRAVPRLPAWIEGVVEFDGRVIPVVDVRQRLTADPLPLSAQTRLLIVTVYGEWCALVVDQVLDVRAYAPGELAPPPALVRDGDGGGGAALYLGSLRRGNDLVLLLDTPCLFSAAEEPGMHLAVGGRGGGA